MINSANLAAILSADIVGYTKHLEQDEQGTIDRWNRMLREFVTPLIEDFGGIIFKETGDGFLAKFPSASAAVRCAAKFQQEQASLLKFSKHGRNFDFRLGVALGDITSVGEDFQGLGIVIADRCQSSCEPKGICISASVFDSVKHEYSTEFFIKREVAFKNDPDIKTVFMANISKDTDISVPFVDDKAYEEWEGRRLKRKYLYVLAAFFYNSVPKFWVSDAGIKGVFLFLVYMSLYLVSSTIGFWIYFFDKNHNFGYFEAILIFIIVSAVFVFVKYYERQSILTYRNTELINNSSLFREEMLRRAAMVCGFEANASDSAFWKTFAHSICGEVQARLPEMKAGTINSSIMLFADEGCTRVRVLAQTDRHRHWDPLEEFPCRDLLGYHAARRGITKVLEDIQSKSHPFRKTSLERNKINSTQRPNYRCILAMPIYQTRSDSSVNPNLVVGFVVVESDRPYHFALNRGDRISISLHPFAAFASLVLKSHPFACPIIGGDHVNA